MISFIFIAVISLISIIATFAVGFSKGNQTEDDQYMKDTKNNMFRLTLLNVLYVVILVVVLVVYLIYF
ncbi:hypothetical protein ASG89_22570 [Paenibacillus sp. Soil766]|uniref:hypothetical protein n=1 Tax=Paenibacillus sp. Soil766 TaxID=1736404 RepID=UPI00070CDC35|nr:hypothetical protein [Paenibacillus sp. Soil766]KRF04165.1 hypothetical protein ASG89_22570 [Paenibacillus sp. Soil766]